MAYALSIGKRGIHYVGSYLKAKPETIGVYNVEKKECYQEHDIDLFWKYRDETGTIREVSIEVKTDTWFARGNYFFETISNKQKDTPGCFLYSKADFFYYYFPEQELHIIPLPRAREWFLPRMDSFPEQIASTSRKHSKDSVYETVGRLVERTLLQKAVDIVIIPYQQPSTYTSTPAPL